MYFSKPCGTDPDSAHKHAEKSCEDLMNQSQHIQQVFHKYTTQDVADNQLRLKFLIRASQYLALQGSALKAMMKHIYSMKVRKTIREEIGDAKFCKIVDKSRDESKKEQMAIVLRFVDKDGIVREHASCKRNDELKRAKANEIVHMLVLDELETSKGLNQIRTLQRKMRNKEWQNLLENVISFRKACNIDIPDINARYIVRQGRAHDQDDNFTIEQQYRVNIFYAAIDSQLQELNIRFNDSSVELLMLSSALDLREGYNSFGIDNICQLVDKFYRDNFTDNEKIYLRV
ncbi:uncharacterized protein LOC18040574 [Citrus clementina]|uniref:uncharacterized protein LOC18040574 n=1 Tax=Citrus clementina TaxID=85681 RepID=UPI000CED39F6|nr:uncharacterized protein LOC18040574 [Citrus x clementina]